MTSTKSAVRTILTASRRYALMAGVCAATCGLVACGSDSKTSTTTTGSTTGGGTGSTTGTTTGTTTGSTTGTSTSTTSCEASGNSSFTTGTSTLSYAPTGGTAVEMPYVLFTYSPNNTDPNKKFAVSIFDYDYCAFSYDHGYSYWPIDGFHAASFFLVDANNSSTEFNSTTYTVGGTTDSIYLNSASPYGSGVTVTSAGAGGGTCTGITYPTLATGSTVTITGTVTPSTTAMAGVTGSLNITLSGDATGTISGNFTSGTCSSANASPPTTIDSCSCSL